MNHTVVDPYLLPQTSARNRIARGLWHIVYALLFRPTPRPLHAWRAFLLRCFGAQLGPNCRIYAKCEIWAPWNLHCDDCAFIADGVVIYNPAPIHLGSHAIVSQQAYLCGATHDMDDPTFPMIWAPISSHRRPYSAYRSGGFSPVSITWYWLSGKRTGRLARL